MWTKDEWLVTSLYLRPVAVSCDHMIPIDGLPCLLPTSKIYREASREVVWISFTPTWPLFARMHHALLPFLHSHAPHILFPRPFCAHIYTCTHPERSFPVFPSLSPPQHRHPPVMHGLCFHVATCTLSWDPSTFCLMTCTSGELFGLPSLSGAVMWPLSHGNSNPNGCCNLRIICTVKRNVWSIYMYARIIFTICI